MIIKGSIAQLPQGLQRRLQNGLGRQHPLWRFARHGLQVQRLAERIEIAACDQPTTHGSRPFKLELADSEDIALRIRELAREHKLTNSRLFFILVGLGYEAMEKRAADMGAPREHNAPSNLEQQPTRANTQEQAKQPTPLAPSHPTQDPQFHATAEFIQLADNLLEQFGLD